MRLTTPCNPSVAEQKAACHGLATILNLVHDLDQMDIVEH